MPYLDPDEKRLWTERRMRDPEYREKVRQWARDYNERQRQIREADPEYWRRKRERDAKAAENKRKAEEARQRRIEREAWGRDGRTGWVETTQGAAHVPTASDCGLRAIAARTLGACRPDQVKIFALDVDSDWGKLWGRAIRASKTRLEPPENWTRERAIQILKDLTKPARTAPIESTEVR